MVNLTKLWVVFVLIVISLFYVSAQNTEMNIEFIWPNDFTTVEGDSLVYVIYSSDGSVFFEGTESSVSNRLKINVPEGNYHLVVALDKPDTQGYDYVGDVTSYFESGRDYFVSMKESSSLFIQILDKNEEPVYDSLVRIDCQERYGVQSYFNTDMFGIIEAKYLPVGNCLVRAAKDESFYRESFNLVQGENKEIIIVFDDYGNNNISWFLIIFLVIFLGAVSYIFYMKRNKPEKTESPKDDIIGVLNKKESLVVNFLLEKQKEHLENGNKNSFFVSQARIIHGASIPKTSLMRVLSSLENKNILLVEKIGKSKRVSFTDWFNKRT